MLFKPLFINFLELFANLVTNGVTLINLSKSLKLLICIAPILQHLIQQDSKTFAFKELLFQVKFVFLNLLNFQKN